MLIRIGRLCVLFVEYVHCGFMAQPHVHVKLAQAEFPRRRLEVIQSSPYLCNPTIVESIAHIKHIAATCVLPTLKDLVFISVLL